METLEQLVAAELATPVLPGVRALGEAVVARHREAARALLFYGSCLRSSVLDGQMLDFYLIVSDYRAAFGKRWLATANRLLPPNVFPIAADGLVGKYAVLSEADFARLCSVEADSVSVWARFAQPSRLVWAADDAARAHVVAAIAEAAPTLFALTLPALETGADPAILDIWRRGFALTYAAELRAERSERGTSIVESDQPRYERFGCAALARVGDRRLPSASVARRRWRTLQRRGKLLTLARLAKASATYAGGIDYLAWKINRHAGTSIAIRPWQRRHPILGALSLLPRLVWRGAVR